MNNFIKSRHFIIGALFGLIAPWIAIYTFLGEVPWLGSLLGFGFGIMGLITGFDTSGMSTTHLLLGTLISMLIWGYLFVVIGRLFSKKN